MNSPDLNLLAFQLAARGFVGQDAAIAAVSRSARSAGVSPVLVDILGDPTAPEVARLRAFGKIATRLADHGTPAAEPQRAHRPRILRRAPAGDAAAA